MWTECYDFLTADRWFFWPILWGLPFCITGIYMLINARKNTEEKGCIMTFLFCWTGFAFFWTIGVGYEVFSEHQHYKDIIENKQYREIEGPVENYSNWYDKRWRTYRTTFLVNGVRFTIKTKDIRKVPSTIDSSSHVLSNGQQLKVRYVYPIVPATEVGEKAAALRRAANQPDYQPPVLKLWVKTVDNK